MLLLKKISTGYVHRWLLVALTATVAGSACQPARVPRPGMVTATKADEIVVEDSAAAAAVAAPPPPPPVPDYVPAPAPEQAAAPKLSDLVHTKLDVTFDYAKQYLNGTATLTLRPHFYPQRSLRLDAKNFLISEVALVPVKGPARPLTYTYEAPLEELNIALDRAYTRDETYTVRIRYTARPNEREAGGSAAITSDKGLYFINPDGKDGNKPRQIWTQGETESNSAWFPTIDRPNQKMTQEIRLTVENQFKTLSNGLLVSSKKNPNGTRTDVWRQDKPHAPYLTMLAVGDFAIVHDTWRGKAVDYYVEPKFAGTARAVFGRTPAMIEFISQKLGVDYAWDKYAQICVRDYVSGAMENTTATIHGEGLQMERRELPDKEWDDYIFHELFHHWFGDLVTAESWSNLPLNESFANYSELLWSEHRFGADGAGYIQQRELNQYLSEAEDKQVPLIRFRYNQREEMFDSHSYAKGGRVLHMLRHQVGDDAFFAALKLYLTRNRFKSAEISDLRLAFEEVTGEDLHWFFDQWMLRPGHAELTVSHEWANDTLTVEVEQHQDSLYSPVYRLPVNIAAWVNGEKKVFPVTVAHGTETFRLPLPAAPELVIFDDDAQVLGVIEPQLSEEQWRYQYYHGGAFLHRYQAVKHCAQRAFGQEAQTETDPADRAVVVAALRDPFWSIRAGAANALEKYAADDLDRVRPEIRRLAEADPNTQVRANAISTLTTLAGDTAATVQLLRRLLADTTLSYRVTAAALSGLTTLNQDEGIEKSLRSLEKSTNADVAGALGEYYAAHPTPARQTWYLRQFDTASGMVLYSMTQQFGQFLQNLPTPDRAPGIERLDLLARTHDQFFVRLGAYQALYSLSETNPDLKLRLETIRAQEKDERVLRFYEMLK
ncbi:MAG: HEAT repeat domain-containing protein [Hymenobacteraceae bacterium]|nr:HEAT repeat domain-containing protein [Hymenobacteraceae bacterium]